MSWEDLVTVPIHPWEEDYWPRVHIWPCTRHTVLHFVQEDGETVEYRCQACGRTVKVNISTLYWYAQAVGL